MLEMQRYSVENGFGEILQFSENCRALTLRNVVERWRDDSTFREFFIRELRETGYPAFFWELPCIEHSRLSEAFECAVIRGDALTHMQADDSDFAEYLDAAASPVAAFRNLGHDALLIAPRRISDADCYGHIAAFVRDAPHAQQHALFQVIASETLKLLTAGHRFWISTSGLGVPWLHVRLDTDPKYYQYRPYADG